MIDSLIEFI
jgi:hypothetical protein